MAKKSFDVETGTWTFDSGVNTHELKLTDLSDAITATAIGHGILQKIGDSYAGAAKATEDSDMTVEEYIDSCIVAGIEQLTSGDWNLRTGGGAGPRITDLALALSEAYGTTEAEAAEKVSELDADQKKAVRAHPAIKPILDRIRAERAAEKAAKSAAESGDAVELPALF